jgi:hypothetical protein
MPPAVEDFGTRNCLGGGLPENALGVSQAGSTIIALAQTRIVEDDRVAVGGGVDVYLDTVTPGVVCRSDGRTDGVLGEDTAEPTVSDDAWLR